MNQAIELLAQYLTEKDQLRHRTLLRDAERNSARLINTTGDDALEGVSVSFAICRRTQLIIDTESSGTGAFVRAEGSVEAMTISSPTSVINGSSSWSDIPVIPGVAPLAYAQIPPEELVLLTGADVFLPALQNALIAKAQQALTPPPEVIIDGTGTGAP